MKYLKKLSIILILFLFTILGLSLGYSGLVPPEGINMNADSVEEYDVHGELYFYEMSSDNSRTINISSQGYSGNLSLDIFYIKELVSNEDSINIEDIDIINEKEKQTIELKTKETQLKLNSSTPAATIAIKIKNEQKQPIIYGNDKDKQDSRLASFAVAIYFLMLPILVVASKIQKHTQNKS